MSEVSEILAKLNNEIDSLKRAALGESRPEEVAYISKILEILKPVQHVLSTHAVIDIDAAKASENGCFSTGAYEESRTIQSELDRLTHTEVTT